MVGGEDMLGRERGSERPPLRGSERSGKGAREGERRLGASYLAEILIADEMEDLRAER